jgi:uncharacterized protein
VSGAALAIMVRAPSSGGKTRLIRALGDCDGLGLRQALLQDTLESIGAVAAQKVVLYTPQDDEAEIRALTPFPATFLPQRGMTIGDRMPNGVGDLLTTGFDAVVLIGSDLPTLPAAHVASALDWLTRHPAAVVLGPAEDGGYYLIGVTRQRAELFEDIPWGTPGVLERTREIAAALGVAVTLVPSWYDVDSVSDLGRVWRAVASREGTARHTHAWLTAAAPVVRARVESETT